jgi:inhibitor of cysteine peptidase
MVQTEIRKKTRIYGLIGVLSAILLVAMIYSLGAAPQNEIINPSPQPSETPQPENFPPINTQPSPLLTFTSYNDLKNFLGNNSGPNYYYTIVSETGTQTPSAAPSIKGSVGATEDSANRGGSYSTTNIQVAGVDEADKVKTDGTYIYLIANDTVYIMNAGATNPQNAQVIAKISSNNTYLSGIYLSQDGNNLAVIGNQYNDYFYTTEKGSSLIMPPYWNSPSTFVKVYDVSNKANPVLARNFTISGNYFNSRMIGNYIYTIITENVFVDSNGTVNLPIIFEEPKPTNIEPSSILYTNTHDSYFTYTTIISLNILDNSQAPTNTTIMMGGTSDMYVSASNIYIVSPTYSQNQYTTNIYRININQATMTLQAKGTVWGNPINQYAMDEYNGNFRIATTTWFNDNSTTSDGAVFKVNRQMNSIYVLNADLTVIGKLEGFKMDESIYSVRFMSTKCYIVTFKQVDPFFVIDMSNPNAPKVTGELKIPGYSSYLYPIDENHIIGLGKENSTLKLSLFDVTNVNAPTETAKYIVDSSYSDSPALYDPHAFLFDAQRQLLVIPVSINSMSVIPIRMPAIDGNTVSTPAYNGNWQGVYIFKVNPTNGITLEGNITQMDSTQTQNGDYYANYNLEITRSLYIDSTLYTFSNSRVQLNNIDNFTLLSKIDLK